MKSSWLTRFVFVWLGRFFICELVSSSKPGVTYVVNEVLIMLFFIVLPYSPRRFMLE
jgi:hypothetical protein